MLQPTTTTTTTTTNKQQTAKRKKSTYLLALRIVFHAQLLSVKTVCFVYFFSIVLLLTFFFLGTSMVSKCYLEFQKYSDSVQLEFTVVT